MLFADVVHSMDIAAAVGAERLREIMADLFDRSVAVVRRYDGTVDKFTGDGIMAVFGAPIALEDHALRASMAALEIQAETAKLAAKVSNRDGIELLLRIGLNSGQVIAGEIGSANASYTAIGEQVGMAQRMESAAPPGGVMLSESTARLVENDVLVGRSRTGPDQGHGSSSGETAASNRRASGPPAQRLATRGSYMGTQRRHRVTRRGCRRRWMRRHRRGPAGNRQEPPRSRNRGECVQRWHSGVHHVLRIAHHRYPLQCGRAVDTRHHRHSRSR